MLLSTWGGVILVLLFTLASGLLGSLFTFYYMTHRLPCRERHAYHVGNGISSYHDEIDGFQDEPEDLDGDDNAQLKTVCTRRVIKETLQVGEEVLLIPSETR